MLTTAAGYRQVATNLDRSLSQVAGDAQVEREIAHYQAKIGDVKSIDDFLSDDRIYRFAMTAFGLEDMSYAKAFMRKVLEEGADDSDAFAVKLADPRYKEFAKTFNFKRYGEATTAFDRTQKGTVDRFVRIRLEQQSGASNEGVRLALYFERKAGEIENAFDILADPALTRVVQTALGLPPESSLSDIDQQARVISERLDTADLQDPEKLDTFITRFAGLWDAENQTSSVQSSAVTLLVQGTARFDQNLLLSIQSLRRGG